MEARFATRLYALGSNGCGQLGVGHCEDLSEPQRCFFQTQDVPPLVDPDALSDTKLDDERITDLVAGGNHTLILTTAGRVYAAGNGRDGRCGPNWVNNNCVRFMPLSDVETTNVTAIAATWEASFLVENCCKVWSIGRGAKGELGVGLGNPETQVLQQAFDVSQCEGIDSEGNILSISASMSHVVVLLSSGSVYGWGSCRKGQLGDELKLRKVSWRPHKIEVPFPVRNVALGREYSFLVGRDGQYLFLGEHKHFADGFGSLRFSSVQVLSTWSSMMWLENGRLHGLGRNDRGQLPPGDMLQVTNLAVGSEHAIACMAQDQIVAWGWGEHGNCGLPVDEHGNVVGRANAIYLDLKLREQIIGLGAGCATSFIWTTEIM